MSRIWTKFLRWPVLFGHVPAPMPSARGPTLPPARRYSGRERCLGLSAPRTAPVPAGGAVLAPSIFSRARSRRAPRRCLSSSVVIRRPGSFSSGVLGVSSTPEGPGGPVSLGGSFFSRATLGVCWHVQRSLSFFFLLLILFQILLLPALICHIDQIVGHLF